MALVACTRMYNVAPGARQAWDALLTWLSAASDVPLDIIDHTAPAPLSALWGRPDLGAALMCGYPFITAPETTRPIPLAAPVVDADWAAGRPVYATHLAVLAETGITDIGALRGGRMGWTSRDSQSGYHAPRRFMSQAGFAGTMVGPLLNPGGVVQALHAGTIDIGPIDSYAYLLMQRHAPALVRGLRILATTRPTAAPLFVASRGIDPAIAMRLRDALLDAAADPVVRPAMGALHLTGFAPVETEQYGALLGV